MPIIASAIRRLYDREKKVEKVASIVNKSKSWVSKRLALTMPNLSHHAKRLLAEGATEDMEILNLVNNVDKEFGFYEAMKMASQF